MNQLNYLFQQKVHACVCAFKEYRAQGRKYCAHKSHHLMLKYWSQPKHPYQRNFLHPLIGGTASKTNK